MNFVYLKEFLSDYSLPTLIIAGVVALISIIIDKFFTKKLSVGVKNYIPFLLSIFLYIAYDMAFVLTAFAFRVESFYAGVLCGSLSAIIVSIANKIKKGEPIPLSATTLLIERLLQGYLNKESATATALILEKLFDSAENESDGYSLTATDVSEAIKGQPDINLSEGDLYYLSMLIYNSVTEFKKSQT